MSDRIGSEGIGTVVLLASKFDSVLQDVGTKFHDDLGNAIEDCQKKLIAQYKNNIANADYRGNNPIIDFSSGIGYSIWKKETGKRNSIENNVVSQMQRLYPSFFTDEKEIKEIFKDLSQIDVIQEKYLFGVFLKNKEKILNEKILNYFSSIERDLVSSIEKNISDCNEDLKILNTESIQTLKDKKDKVSKLLDVIVEEVNGISKRIDIKIDQYKKELFYEWSFDVKEIPTETIGITIHRDSTFWGSDKRCQENVIFPNIHKLIENLGKEFNGQFTVLSNLWKKKIETIKSDLRNKVNELIIDAIKKDDSGNLEQRILNNTLNEITDRMENSSTVENTIVDEFKSSLEQTLMNVERTTVFRYGSMEEDEARQRAKNDALKRVDEVRLLVGSLISSIKADTQKLFDESGNRLYTDFNKNQDQFKNQFRVKFDESIHEYELELEEKEKNVAILNNVIKILTNIKEKI